MHFLVFICLLFYSFFYRYASNILYIFYNSIHIFLCVFTIFHVYDCLFVYNKQCFCTVQKAGLHTCKTCLCMNILLFLTYFLLQNGRYFTSSLLRYIPMPRKLLFCRCATDGSGFKKENKISSVSYTENFILYNIAISIQKHLLSSKWPFHKKVPPVYRVSTFWVGDCFHTRGKLFLTHNAPEDVKSLLQTF